MEVYAAIDLHASNSFLAVVDREGKRVFKRRLVNDSAILLKALEPYKEAMQGIAVESTFNWYWVVDAMMEAGYKVHLANPAAIQKYRGMKHSDDNSDAVWLAEMLRLGILPEGYIYPREERPVRDLLRKRMHLVKLRTSLIIAVLENNFRLWVRFISRSGERSGLGWAWGVLRTCPMGKTARWQNCTLRLKLPCRSGVMFG
jgi:transposase